MLDRAAAGTRPAPHRPRPLVAAVEAIAGEQIEDRVIYLERVESE
jgi:hypothetical protein